MIKNYLKVAFRNIRRNKLFSAINILGLAVGMACSIFILLWVQHERSYDKFHKKGANIYRTLIEGSGIQACLSIAPIDNAMRKEIPAVKNTVTMARGDGLFEYGDRRFQEMLVFYMDSTFLQVFDFPLIKGNKNTAMLEPNSILLTEKTAKKYFGDANPIGKVLRMSGGENLTVTGVLADVPSNSHIQFDMIIPLRFFARNSDDFKNNVWDNFNYYTYVQLDEKLNSPAELKKVNKQINDLYKRHEKNLKLEWSLQPLFDIHLRSNYLGDLPGHGNIQYVRIFSLVAIIVLIVACINFMNLATARASRRAKEVGMRKVAGAIRTQIIRQFMGESILIAFISLLIAIGIVWLLLPAFNNLSGKEITLNFLDGYLFLLLPGIAVLTGLVSGSYPALFLSSFQPAKVLKGTFSFGNRGAWMRNGLVIVQFVISISLMVAAFVVYNQLKFIRNKNLGYDRENLLYVPVTGKLWGSNDALRTNLLQNQLTSDFTFLMSLPTNLETGTINVEWPGKDPKSQVIFPQLSIDENFQEVFKTKVIAGRGFLKDSKADEQNYMLNETAIRIMGMKPETAIGQPFSLWGNKGVIIGVVKDFNFKPIHKAIEPLVLRYSKGGGVFVVRTKPGKTEATIDTLKKICTQLNPEYPFTYDFIDQDLAKLYRAEQRMGSIFNVFTVLAIFISCLGLFGLTNYIAEKRTKEIGIRKVIGASVTGIVALLSKGLIMLVLAAILIATPLSWWAMNNWLHDFAYHIDIGWVVFVIAGLTSVLIAMITVSFQAIKAAMANPIKSLRSE
jgi:ABC-type antimicrobial peptide transport system permease subunit